MPPDVLILGVPLMLVVPALVQGAKLLGLPSRWAGVASIVSCAIVFGLMELERRPDFAGVARWLLASLVYGLAASGLYSQLKELRNVSGAQGSPVRDAPHR